MSYGKENLHYNQQPQANFNICNKAIPESKHINKIQMNIQKKQVPACEFHRKQIGRYFCDDCLRYNICEDCKQQDHKMHRVRVFKHFDEAKEFTKEIVLQELEETLKKMKSKENEIKNRNQEIVLIKDKLRLIQNSIIYAIKEEFETIAKNLSKKYCIEEQKYQDELDVFYDEYNRVNQYLRENLMEIIDGNIQLETFSKALVFKEIEDKFIPHFGKFKNNLQKIKKYYRDVKEEVEILSKTIKGVNGDENRNQQKYEKYDKFLKDKTNCDAEHNSSLMKTLNIIENNQCNMPLVRNRLRT